MERTKTPGDTTLAPRPTLVFALTIAALAFRVAAYASPSRFIAIVDPLELPLGALGVLHLVCGVWVWRAFPSSLTRVYLLTGLGGCIHWGGSIGGFGQGAEIAFLVLYLAATAMADGAFLDLALRYPPSTRWRSRVPTWAFYVLALVTACCIPVAPFVSTGLVEAGLGLVIMVAMAMSILGGIVFLVKWVRATPDERRAYALTPIVGALLLSTALDLLGDEGVLPGPADAWTLPYALVPVTLAWAILRMRSAE